MRGPRAQDHSCVQRVKSTQPHRNSVWARASTNHAGFMPTAMGTQSMRGSHMLMPKHIVTVSARGARASSMREMNRASAGIVIHHQPSGGKAEYRARPAEAPINASPHTCARDTRCKTSRYPMRTSLDS